MAEEMVEGLTTSTGSMPKRGSASAGNTAAETAQDRGRHGLDAVTENGNEQPMEGTTAATATAAHWAIPGRTPTEKQQREDKKGGAKPLKAHSLIDKVYHWKNLERAYRRVKRNKGAHGLDRVTIRMFDANWEVHLREIQRKLMQRRYTWQPVMRVYIPKSSNPKECRPIGIPVVSDRIVGQALIQVLDPIFDSHLSDRSFAYRKGRNAHDAIATIQRDLKAGFWFVVDADIKSCFDEICHLVAMSRVTERVADGRVLDLLEAYLRCGVSKDGRIFVPERGIPQGGVVSPFLMNLVLDVLDRNIEAKGYRLVRYADDFVILCRTKAEAQQALTLATETLATLKLRVHPEKTHLVNAKRDSFAFLGFQLRRNSLHVHPKAIERFKEKVRYLTRRQQGRNIEAVIADLTPVVRGWARYFGVAHCVGTFMSLDKWVRMRLRAFKFKRKCQNDNWRLPNERLARWGFLSLLDCRKTVTPLCLSVKHA